MRRFSRFAVFLGVALTLGLSVCPFRPAFALGGEPLGPFFAKEALPAVQDVKEAFGDIYGEYPSAWPKELRRIHHIEVSWSQRALGSDNFREAFTEEEREGMRLQIKAPLDYWARAIWSGSVSGEWENAGHLAARDVPKVMLRRFLKEIFPLMWRDLNSTTHRKQYLLERDDALFAPDIPSIPEILKKRKEDVLAYNRLLAEAVEKYAEAKDLPMLGLLLGRADTVWRGDPDFRLQLIRQKRRLENRIVEAFNTERETLLGAVCRDLDPFYRYWIEEDGTERHVRLEPSSGVLFDGPGALFGLGANICVKQRNPWTADGNDAPHVKTSQALHGVWRDFPFNGLATEEKAEPVAWSEKCLVVRVAGQDNGMTLAFFPGWVPRAGYRLEIEPAGSPDMPEEVFWELAGRVEKGFVSAVLERFGGSPVAGGAPRDEGLSKKPDRELLLQVSGYGNGESGSMERMSCRIDARLTERGAPVGGVELAVEMPDAGSLYSPRATGGGEDTLYVDTDPRGRAVIVYHSPEIGEFRSFPGDMIKLAVRDDSSGIREVIGFRIQEREYIEMEAEHELIPGDDSFPNRIRFRFFGKDVAAGSACEVFLRSKSGLGLFRSGSGEWEKAPVKLDAQPEEWQSVLYKWNGDSSMNMPLDETVIVEIPALNLYETVDFRVGVMPVVSEVDIGGKPSGYPGSYVPLKLTLADRLNPELDLECFLESFGLSPVVEIEPTDFTPCPLEEEDARLLEKVMQALPGVTVPKETMTFQPEEWLLARKENAGWVIAGGSSDFRPASSRNTMELPGFIPWLWGDYTFRIRLAFEKDDGLAEKSFGQTETHVFEIRPRQGEKNLQTSGILPLILLHSAMFQDEQARLAAAKAERLLCDEKPAEAAAVLGDAFSKRLWRDLHGTAAPENKKRQDPGTKVSPPRDGDAALSFLCHLGGAFMDRLLGLSPGLEKGEDLFRGRPEEEQRLEDILQGFLAGYGDYGLAAVSKKGLTGLAVFDEQGRRLYECPQTVFPGGSPVDRLYNGANSIVIVFRLGETLVLDISGSKDPLEAVKILPNGVNRIYCCDGKKEERLTLFGDVVDPTRRGAVHDIR
ncbi:MAG: hypothetical protein ACP5DY_03450 [Thermovirgaceae bacterium]